MRAILFQSAPAIAGGRCPHASKRWRLAHIAFQSAPAIAGGRCPLRTCAAPLGRHCFNPRPPLLAGDALSQHYQSHRAGGVSIRARHCWRAMPRWRFAWSLPIWRFNPRPPLLAGDALLICLIRAAFRSFQSAPAIAGGRCPGRSCCYLCCSAVSIRARHCWRAMP